MEDYNNVNDDNMSLALGNEATPIREDMPTKAVPKYVKEAPKPIVIFDNRGEPEYELNFNRASIEYAEKRGFEIGKVFDFPLSGIQTLFWLAFRMHHKGINKVVTDKVYDELTVDKTALIGRLYDLYNSAVESLTDDSTNSPNGIRKVEL